MESLVSSQNTALPIPGLPLILDGNFFKVIAEDGLKVTGQCTLCPSRIMGLKTTTSNFNTHLKKMHPERHKVYEEYKIEKGQTIKKRRSSHDFHGGKPLTSSPSPRRRISNSNGFSSNSNGMMRSGISLSGLGQGRSKLNLLDKIQADMMPKRRQSSCISQTNPLMRSLVANRRPHSLQGSIPASSLPPTLRPRRKETDDIVFNYIIKSLSPTLLVESPYFISLVSGLCANPRRVMSRNTLEGRINMQSLVKRSEIARFLSKVDFVCVTADAWMITNDPSNTFISMTAHWIGLDLKLRSSLLTCRRLQQELTYEKLVEIITEVFGIYNIQSEKICCIVTNSASNLLPTRIYQIQHIDDDQVETVNGLHDHYKTLDDDTLTNENLSFYNISSILSDSENQSPHLPSHYDCPTQTLIGVLATSTFETLSNPDRPTSYIFQSSIAKCQALWKACANKESGEKIQEVYGLEILIPNRLNWGSFLEAILSLLHAQDVLDDIFLYFALSPFEDTEFEFLEEYVKAMDPMTEALSILQDDKDLYMGSFVPTILSVKTKLEELNSEELKYTKPLIESLLTGLKGPFMDIITLDEKARPLILASILHPSFKLSWIPIDNMAELKEWYLEEANNFGVVVDEDTTNGEPSLKKERKSESLENDFFSFGTEENEIGKEDILVEFLNYLETPCERVESGQLDRFPNVKKLFITFNTAIASSVPVERLINFSEVSFAPSRSILKDDMLENMMILKCN